jgi:hypothetical protein
MARLSYGEWLHSYIKKELPKKILADLKDWRLFSELDMHGVAYHHLRTKLSGKRDWYVRCDVRTKIKGAQPDIMIFNRYQPKFVIQLAFKILPSQRLFPLEKLRQDREKLKRLRAAYPGLGKGYIIAVFDSREDRVESLKSESGWEKHYYNEVFLNVHTLLRDYADWKESWESVRRDQVA